MFGASGQIGDALLPLLDRDGWDVRAVSRSPRPDRERLRWTVGALDAALAPPREPCDAVLSLGPLDVFAAWQDRVGPVAPRVVAFGSTSITAKSASDDPAERAVAERLRIAEEALFAFGARNGVAVTILRPTLVYGRGRDRTLSRIAAFARRRGVVVLPRNATGLRQPVHVDDLATAALAAVDAPHAAGRAYVLPGGETLAFDAMVDRMLAVLVPRPRLLRVPAAMFRGAVASARALKLVEGFHPALLARLDRDLVFDYRDARRDLGYAPRMFVPLAGMFTAPQD